jgi:hypothetical protein
MKSLIRITVLCGALVVAPFVGVFGMAQVGAATSSSTSSSLFPVDYTVDASTTLKKLDKTVVVPPGSFIGGINLTTGKLSGKLTLPPASTTVSLAGIGLVTATFVLSPVGKITGHVNFSTFEVTSTAKFNVLVTSVEPLGLPVNIVGNSCGTSTPVSVTFSGKFSLSGSSAFSGTYTIPPLSNCELATPALNLLIPGPGNVFSATFAPATS